MILSHAKDIAEDYTDQKLRDVVITVPVYFNQVNLTNPRAVFSVKCNYLVKEMLPSC